MKGKSREMEHGKVENRKAQDTKNISLQKMADETY